MQTTQWEVELSGPLHPVNRVTADFFSLYFSYEVYTWTVLCLFLQHLELLELYCCSTNDAKVQLIYLFFFTFFFLFLMLFNQIVKLMYVVVK